MAPEPFSFLPMPTGVLVDATDPPTEGWWTDPLGSDASYQRYFDGTKWTQYVRGRSLKSWTRIFPDRINTEVDPNALGIPRPPAVPDPPPEPPTAGWWKDPVERKLKQAHYYDGTQWTDLIAPTNTAGLRLVTRRRDPQEVIQEQKAALAGAKTQHAADAPAKRRWPWSRRGN
jgi:hypothetical protein